MKSSKFLQVTESIQKARNFSKSQSLWCGRRYSFKFFSYFPHVPSYSFIFLHTNIFYIFLHISHVLFLHIPSYFPHISSDFPKSHGRRGYTDFKFTPLDRNFFHVPSFTPTQCNPQNFLKFFQVLISGECVTWIFDLPCVKFSRGGGEAHETRQNYGKNHTKDTYNR